MTQLIRSFFFVFLAFGVHAQLSIELEEFASGFALPVDIVHDGTELLYVVEKAGIIKIVEPDGTVLAEPFLDITDRVNAGGSELGLLGLDFHPDYANNGQFFVNYTNNADLTVIARFSRDDQDPMKGDPDSEDKLIQFGQPFNNHNGGDLDFGPDGYLYIASGDGGSANDPGNNSQSINSFLGKMLRIDVNGTEGYEVPDDNPFVGIVGLDEIWSYGLRNPWRISFDRETGDLWIGDVGQNQYEEIDLQLADSEGGENYGWKCYEGDNEYISRDCDLSQDFTFPVYVYNNNRFGDGCSVTGGYVYRGSEFPELYGKYIYCDYCSGRFWALEVTATDTTNVEVGRFTNNEFGAFGEDLAGELYASALREGIVYKIKVPCALMVDVDKIDQDCPGVNDGEASITLSDTSADVTILWSTGDTTMVVDSLEPGTYTVRVQGGGCDILDSVEVGASNLSNSCLMDTTLGGDYCTGDTVYLEACDAPADYTYQWYLNRSLIADSDTSRIAVTESGMYSVAFIGSCNLGVSKTLEFQFIATPEKPVITRVMDTLFVDIVAEGYDWFLDGMFIGSSTDPQLETTTNGTYTVQGVNTICKGPLSDGYVFVKTSNRDVYTDEVLIFPNPIKDQMFIENRSDEELKLTIYNVSGERIQTLDLTPGQNSINVQDFPSGVYSLVLRGKLGTTERQVVK